MKNRHLMGALIAFAPVVAIAQAGMTPPVGNASESSTMNTPASEPMMDNAAGVSDPATTTNSVATTTPDPMAPTTTPDPTKPKPTPRG
ncbi:hypothetical protein [Sphingomonas prati]|uniref:Proteophosphoglycan ppg4 n=1 Tax=Sphingomonas prati TaxID=1843237 RepID=A0A7W9BTJ0_9SPHN|nr:hypothetical protein [Sphingomonas prati]MBB5729761.1 hypothetical protein [Sphingomonas prati]GGE89727.1 hypothetical protein GCM10011404_23240 [Sphingomonas prati]